LEISFEAGTEPSTLNFYFAHVKGAFTMAPDIQVWRKDRSVLGGIYESSEDILKPVMHNVSPTDIDNVWSLLTNIVSLKKMSDSLGGTLKYPDL
jgi:hypothetical protein